MIADKLYEIVREADHANKTILFYVPCPWHKGVNGRAGGFIRATTNDALTLLRGRGEDLEVDVEETERMLTVTVEGIQDKRRVWLKRIRESNTLGRGSCSAVDEAMEDSELLESLAEYETFKEAWESFCDSEEVFWERQGISWERGED